MVCTEIIANIGRPIRAILKSSLRESIMLLKLMYPGKTGSNRLPGPKRPGRNPPRSFRLRGVFRSRWLREFWLLRLVKHISADRKMM